MTTRTANFTPDERSNPGCPVILRAAHLGMCFGVRDAITLALEHADAGPLTILGDLVHNPTVLGALEAKGIAVAQDVADVRTPTGDGDRPRHVGAHASPGPAPWA